MKKQVEFLKDFATKKKGDTGDYDSLLASNLVNVQKVAKYVTVKKHKDIKE